MKQTNSELLDSKLKYARENDNIVRGFETENKRLRKVFSEERQLNLSMLKKINESEDLKYSKISKNTQTNAHPEIPYSVKTQLPPIFNSQLCTISPVFVQVDP